MRPEKKPPYMKVYMRNDRAWRKGVEAIMRLPPEQRFEAAQELHGRLHHKDIHRVTKAQALFVELLRRIRTAPDAVPFFEVERTP